MAMANGKEGNWQQEEITDANQLGWQVEIGRDGAADWQKMALADWMTDGNCNWGEDSVATVIDGNAEWEEMAMQNGRRWQCRMGGDGNAEWEEMAMQNGRRWQGRSEGYGSKFTQLQRTQNKVFGKPGWSIWNEMIAAVQGRWQEVRRRGQWRLERQDGNGNGSGWQDGGMFGPDHGGKSMGQQTSDHQNNGQLERWEGRESEARRWLWI
jgi:hypothetical protein